MPGFLELVIMLITCLIPLVLVIWFVRYLIEMSRERRWLRIEVSKLAHELEGMRKEPGEPAR